MKLLLSRWTATSVIVEVFISDSSSSSGAGLAGLVYNSAGLTAYWHRPLSSGSGSAITLATMTKGTWASGGFVEIDGTNMPGWYQLGVPDTVFDDNDFSVSIHLQGAANMVPLPIEIQLDAQWAAGEFDGTTVGSGSTSTLTKLSTNEPSADNTLKNWILYVPGIREARRITSYTGSTRGAGHRAWTSGSAVSGGSRYILIPIDDVEVGTNSDKTGYSLSSSQTFNVTGNITGNVSGSVGSVTGNLGGNVVGNISGDVTSLSAAAITDILATVIETAGNISLGNAIAYILAIAAGESPSAGVFKTPDGTATRVSGTVNSAGVRSAITLTPPS